MNTHPTSASMKTYSFALMTQASPTKIQNFRASLKYLLPINISIDNNCNHRCACSKFKGGFEPEWGGGGFVLLQKSILYCGNLYFYAVSICFLKFLTEEGSKIPFYPPLCTPMIVTHWFSNCEFLLAHSRRSE